MAFPTKPILGAAVGLGSVAVLGIAAKTAKDTWDLKPHKISAKPLIKGMVGITIGTGLLSAAGSMIK